MITLKQETAIIGGELKSCEPIICNRCGSENLIRRGYRRNKNHKVQRFGCKDCGHRFVVELDGFRKMVYRPETVTLVLDLYFKGLSLQKIVDHLKQFHHLEVHNTIVLKWIQKYVKVMGDYVSQLKPEVSNVWHSDEMVVNVNGKYRWL